MRKTTLYILGIALIALPVWASEQKAPLSEAEKVFREIDIIPDGRIDAGEYDIYANASFKKLDRDGDGNLTEEECLKNCFQGKEPGKEQYPGIVKYRFSPIDIDESGYISHYEYILFEREQFTRMDVNKNGVLDTEEFCNVYEPVKPCIFTGFLDLEETP